MGRTASSSGGPEVVGDAERKEGPTLTPPSADRTRPRSRRPSPRHVCRGARKTKRKDSPNSELIAHISLDFTPLFFSTPSRLTPTNGLRSVDSFPPAPSVSPQTSPTLSGRASSVDQPTLGLTRQKNRRKTGCERRVPEEASGRTISPGSYLLRISRTRS